MRKTLLIALALAAAPLAAEAQNTANVNATATILANVVVSPLTNLNFGTIASGAGAAVTTGAPAGGGQTLGEFQIVHNADVNVTTTVPANLTGPGTPIPVTFVCAYASSSQGATDIADTACDALPTRAVTAPGTNETTFVQVGGSILAGSTNVAAGAYSATMTFTVTPIA